MKINKNLIDFTDEIFFIGLDIHKNQWTVSISNNGVILKKFSMDPSVEILVKYLRKNYPGGEYRSVYEAGFCGFWIDRELNKVGIKNIIVNPSDIPTRGKERVTKSDKVDSAKLSRELANGSLKSIYIPSQEEEQFRTLARLRYQLVTNKVRQKNRIKSLLYYYGIKVPEGSKMKTWSKSYKAYLRNLDLSQELIKQSLEISLDQLDSIEEKIENVKHALTSYIKNSGIENDINNLTTVPGIGITTAITLYSEISDINRFRKFDNLCSFIGLVPAVISSGDSERILGICNRQSKYLRSLIIEAAWVAIKKDPALTLKFGQLCKKMCKQKAIIRIAKKLLSRVSYVLKNKKEYELAVIQ